MKLGRLASSKPKIGGPLRAWVECSLLNTERAVGTRTL